MNKTLKYFQILSVLTFSLCVSLPNAIGQFTNQEFDKMADEMATGTVNDVTVTELKEEKEEVILLDAREKKEYEISHIPGAIWVGYDDFKKKRVKELNKDAKIVVYCSVGYRSERVGEKLQKAGFSDVSNLKGSIFKWVNEGNEIVNDKNETTEEVHGFNKEWGKWVKNGKVVY